MGGVEACIHNVTRRIVRSGHDAVVITPSRGGRDDRALEYRVDRLSPLLTKSLFANFNLGKLCLENILKGIQKKYKFDIWQVTVGYPFGAASADFFNRNGIPCVLRCSGEDIQMMPSLKYGYRLNKEVDKRVKENYKKFNAVIALSGSMKEDYLSLGIPESKIFVIPNGVDHSKFGMEVDRARVRDELGVSDRQKLIITVGRNHPKKGFKHIPGIIKRLAGEGFDFKWLLVGKENSAVKRLAEREGLGSYLIDKEVRSGISEKGKFEIPDERLIRYYKASDIFVFPTLIETFGKVIVEAMAAGLPIVTTDAPGAGDIIRHEGNGLKCRVDDIGGLTGSVSRILSDTDLAKRLSENALEDAKNYDWSRVTDMYLDLYKKLLTRHCEPQRGEAIPI